MSARRRLRSIKRAWPGSSSTRRIVTDCSAGIRLSSHELMCHSEGQCRAPPQRGVTPDVAPMPPHEHLHIGQAHTFPWHVLRADTTERLEDFGNIVRGNTPPVVADMKHGDLRTAFGRDHDLPRAAGVEVGY